MQYRFVIQVSDVSDGSIPYLALFSDSSSSQEMLLPDSVIYQNLGAALKPVFGWQVTTYTLFLQRLKNYASILPDDEEILDQIRILLMDAAQFFTNLEYRNEQATESQWHALFILNLLLLAILTKNAPCIQDPDIKHRFLTMMCEQVQSVSTWMSKKKLEGAQRFSFDEDFLLDVSVLGELQNALENVCRQSSEEQDALSTGNLTPFSEGDEEEELSGIVGGENEISGLGSSPQTSSVSSPPPSPHAGSRSPFFRPVEPPVVVEEKKEQLPLLIDPLKRLLLFANLISSSLLIERQVEQKSELLIKIYAYCERVLNPSPDSSSSAPTLLNKNFVIAVQSKIREILNDLNGQCGGQQPERKLAVAMADLKEIIIQEARIRVKVETISKIMSVIVESQAGCMSIRTLSEEHKDKWVGAALRAIRQGLTLVNDSVEEGKLDLAVQNLRFCITLEEVDDHVLFEKIKNLLDTLDPDHAPAAAGPSAPRPF